MDVYRLLGIILLRAVNFIAQCRLYLSACSVVRADLSNSAAYSVRSSKTHSPSQQIARQLLSNSPELS